MEVGEGETLAQIFGQFTLASSVMGKTGTSEESNLLTTPLHEHIMAPVTLGTKFTSKLKVEGGPK